MSGGGGRVEGKLCPAQLISGYLAAVWTDKVANISIHCSVPAPAASRMVFWGWSKISLASAASTLLLSFVNIVPVADSLD